MKNFLSTVMNAFKRKAKEPIALHRHDMYEGDEGIDDDVV